MRTEPITPIQTTEPDAAAPEQLQDLAAPAVEGAEQVVGGVIMEGFQAINAGLKLLGEAVASGAETSSSIQISRAVATGIL